jgi:hypothetical protein
MKIKGGFSDDVIVFNNKDEFLRYQHLYKEQQKEIANTEKKQEYRDYATITEKLKDQLDKNNAMLDKSRNIIVDKVTQKPLSLTEVSSAEEKSRIAECMIIFKQIENYKKLNNLEVKLAMDKQQLESLEHGTEAYNALDFEIKETQESIKSCLKIEEQQTNERSQINGVQAALEVEKEYQKRHEQGSHNKNERTEHEEPEKLTMEEWKKKISDGLEERAKNSPVVKSNERNIPSKDDR